MIRKRHIFVTLAKKIWGFAKFGGFVVSTSNTKKEVLATNGEVVMDLSPNTFGDNNARGLFLKIIIKHSMNQGE